jgi:hypothetical protein
MRGVLLRLSGSRALRASALAGGSMHPLLPEGGQKHAAEPAGAARQAGVAAFWIAACVSLRQREGEGRPRGGGAGAGEDVSQASAARARRRRRRLTAAQAGRYHVGSAPEESTASAAPPADDEVRAAL